MDYPNARTLIKEVPFIAVLAGYVVIYLPKAGVIYRYGVDLGDRAMDLYLKVFESYANKGKDFSIDASLWLRLGWEDTGERGAMYERFKEELTMH